MLERGCRFIGIVIFPLSLVTVAFAHEGLSAWLDADFAAQSAPVLQWLAIGVFANSMAYMPFALLQGVGRPDIPAKFHALQIVPYVVALKFAIDTWGITGAAMVWTARVTIDLAGLLFVAESVLEHRAHLLRTSLSAGAGIVLLFAVMAAPNVQTATVTCLVVLAAYAMGAWRFALDTSEKVAIQRLLSRGSSA
jgi:O-antigen/teichoic acid export membrane protein